MEKLGSDALALRRQVFHAGLVPAGSEGEGELPLFQTREQMHVSVQPAGAAHTQHKHTCIQAHAHSPGQEHVVQSRPSSQLSHFMLDKSSWAQTCSEPTLCWPLASTFPAACEKGYLILAVSLEKHGWVSQAATGVVW